VPPAARLEGQLGYLNPLVALFGPFELVVVESHLGTRRFSDDPAAAMYTIENTTDGVVYLQRVKSRAVFCGKKQYSRPTSAHDDVFQHTHVAEARIASKLHGAGQNINDGKGCLGADARFFLVIDRDRPQCVRSDANVMMVIPSRRVPYTQTPAVVSCQTRISDGRRLGHCHASRMLDEGAYGPIFHI